MSLCRTARPVRAALFRRCLSTSTPRRNLLRPQELEHQKKQDAGVTQDLEQHLTSKHMQPPSSEASSSFSSNQNQSQTQALVPTHLYSRLPEHCFLPDGTPDYVRLILNSRVYDLLEPTPMTSAKQLSLKTGCEVFLKREDLQPVFSFKIRGAFNLVANLSPQEKAKGVIACSAGNHAQGVALASKQLGIQATIVMPTNTPYIKWSAVERNGGRVLLFGNDFDEAKRECARLAEEQGLTNIPPFDDPYVIAGQGTAAAEIMRQVDPAKLNVVFACVGGGGLLAGTAAYLKAIAPPHVKVVGVETFDGDAMKRSVGKNERVNLPEVGLFSEGTAVRLVGEESFRVCQKYVDDFVLVSNDEICAAIKDVFEDTRGVVEPAGALALAGMKKYISHNNLQGSGQTMVAYASGANMNFDRLRFVAERAELGEKREALLSVIIPEQPGSFVKLHSIIHPRTTTEFSYRCNNTGDAHIFCSFLLSAGAQPASAGASEGPQLSPQEAKAEELGGIIGQMESEGFAVRDLADDELAKDHARYLVGGRASVVNERLIRFEFPERPGALRKFLVGLHAGWNISLFHYRNQGGDLGKVLVGVQVPTSEDKEFTSFLADLGYSYVEETDNPVYQTFLR